MMLFNPTRIGVNNMKNGMNVQNAADDALNDISEVYPNFDGALICMDANGKYGASKNMQRPFHFVYRDKNVKKATTLQIQ